MADPLVPLHYIVAPWTAGDPNVNPLGTAGSPDANVYNNIEAAKTRARTLAAAQPGSVWVVYMAAWYAFTDTTPVTLERVLAAPVA